MKVHYSHVTEGVSLSCQPVVNWAVFADPLKPGVSGRDSAVTSLFWPFHGAASFWLACYLHPFAASSFFSPCDLHALRTRFVEDTLVCVIIYSGDVDS